MTDAIGPEQAKINAHFAAVRSDIEALKQAREEPAMTEAQAKAIVSSATGYSVDESRALALEMAQNLGLDLLEAVKTLGGVPAVRFT